MSVQALGPEAAVEGLDEGIVSRLAGPAEVQGDAMGIGPQVQVPGDELGPDPLPFSGAPGAGVSRPESG